MRMRLQMLSQLGYPLGEQCYLNLGGASITVVSFKVRNDSSLLLFVQNLCSLQLSISQDYITALKSMHNYFQPIPLSFKEVGIKGIRLKKLML
jgi:hypothetical protein